MIYDTIHKIEDFKNIIKTNKINLNKLRITIQEKSLGAMTVEVSIILTIPYIDYILRHYVGKHFFNRYFYHDKSFEEYKEYKNFIENCCEKAKQHFGQIIEGFWSKEDEL